MVENVFPTSTSIPENQLKFYVHFSAPVQQGEAYSHIRLLDAEGTPVDAAFLEIGEELWDPNGTRLTLFFDPGRVKRELVPNLELGRALTAGKSYTLVIDRKWKDVAGCELREEFRKTFKAVRADYKAIDPATWKVIPPKARTRGALVVEFGESLDHALASRVIEVEDASGSLVDGGIDLEQNESVWRFTPGAAWTPGRHSLAVETILEDLAGNAVHRPFEIDQFTGVTPLKIERVRVEFEVE